MGEMDGLEDMVKYRQTWKIWPNLNGVVKWAGLKVMGRYTDLEDIDRSERYVQGGDNLADL